MLGQLERGVSIYDRSGVVEQLENDRGRLRRLTNGGEVIESLSREQSWPSAATCQTLDTGQSFVILRCTSYASRDDRRSGCGPAQ
ncbi:hypothetical protein ACW2Q0_22520 [Nocardia sp. R16R-3T]